MASDKGNGIYSSISDGSPQSQGFVPNLAQMHLEQQIRNQGWAFKRSIFTEGQGQYIPNLITFS